MRLTDTPSSNPVLAMVSRILLAFVAVVLVGCSLFQAPDTGAELGVGSSAPQSRELTPEQYLGQLAVGHVSYVRDVKPIIDNRCVVCHGCYDGPCQLKLESAAALDRGASKVVIYDGNRLNAIAPSRMGVDATSTAEWRRKGFYPVLNERRESPAANLDNSVLARMLLLKQQHPLPDHGTLSDEFDFGLNRKLECPTIREFDEYAERHPGWGMPYGFPGLKPKESQVLLDWIAQGARYSAAAPPPPATLAAIDHWEAFMNGDGLKERLVARHLYEHLFLGHLHFRGHAPDEFFRLVRSTTPPGEAIREISSLRPYDDPGPRMLYRLKPLDQKTIVDKNHDVYEIGDTRIKRLRELFILPDYEVKTGSLPFCVERLIG